MPLELTFQNVTAEFGRLRDGDDAPYVFGFRDPQSGIIVTVPMDPGPCREFLQAALDSIGGVTPARRPKLVIPRGQAG